MRRIKTETPRAGAAAGLLLLPLAGACSPPPAEAPETTGVTVFEGARLIVGDGSDPLENAAFVVDEDRFAAVGAAGEVEAPASAARVDLTGRRVIPALIDTHVHFSTAREELLEDLRRKAYYGVGAAMGLGRDVGEDVYRVRAEIIPGVARYRMAGRGITMPEPGRSDVPYWVTNEEEARAAVEELAALAVDVVKIWVDDRNGRYEKMPPEVYGAVIDEAHRHGLRVTATSSPSRTPRACCARGSTRSRTASAIRTSTTSSSS